jgi:hypothetical protein
MMERRGEGGVGEPTQLCKDLITAQVSTTWTRSSGMKRCCDILLPFIKQTQQSFATSSSLKLDVGGGFLGCLWKFNEIKSKTVRAFAQRVEDLVFVFKFISVQIGFLVSLAVFDEAVDQTA